MNEEKFRHLDELTIFLFDLFLFDANSEFLCKNILVELVKMQTARSYEIKE